MTRSTGSALLAAVLSVFVLLSCGTESGTPIFIPVPADETPEEPDPPGTPYNPGTVSNHDDSQTYDGLTLIFDAIANRAVVIDMDGDVVATFDSPSAAFPFVDFAKPVEGGALLLSPSDSTVTVLNLFPPRILAMVDAEGEVLWQWSGAPTYARLHHDFDILANGNVLALVSPTPDPNHPGISDEDVQDDVILEIDVNTGDILWTWSTADHYDQLPLTMAQRDLIADQTIIDIFHTNGVAELPDVGYDLDMYPEFTPGNLMISQRQTNLVFIIERATGDIVWSIDETVLGNVGQHHARMIPAGLPGAGNILLFDNGCCAGWPVTTRTYTRVLEIDPTDQSIVWSYDPGAPFFSEFRSGAQRLPNGNTLITMAQDAQILEVTPAGDVVWQFTQSAPSGSYRAYRIDFEWFFGGNPSTIAPFPW